MFFASAYRRHNAANEVTRPLLAGGSVAVAARPRSWSSKKGTCAPAYAHGRSGNMTDDTKHTYYYDFANHLVAAVLKDTGDTVGDYRYDALGRRVRKVVDDVSDTLDGTTLFYYDGMRVIEEGRLDGQGAYTATHQYVWGFYLDELLVFDYDAQGDFDLEDTSDQRGHPFQDFIYSTAAVMDADGNVLERYDYEAYGAPNFWTGDYADTRAETQVHLDFLFTGQRYDAETGLYHYKGRVFHPTLGRFLQRDPGPDGDHPARMGAAPSTIDKGTSGQRDLAQGQRPRIRASNCGILRPVSPSWPHGWAAVGDRRRIRQVWAGEYSDGMSLYKYVGSNPLSHTDPSGLYYGYNPDDCEKKYCLNECGVWKCNKAKRQAEKALAKAAELFPGESLHNGENDAWRHCYWNCKMVRKVGNHCAKYIADQHEEAGSRAGQPQAEADMDYHNNYVGRELGGQQGSCTELCQEALDGGRLRTLQ